MTLERRRAFNVGMLVGALLALGGMFLGGCLAYLVHG